LGTINTGPGPPGWASGAWLTTLRCKNMNIAQSKEVKTGSNMAESSRESCDSKRAVLPIMMMMMKYWERSTMDLFIYIYIAYLTTLTIA
jgi:hypothetical protein